MFKLPISNITPKHHGYILESLNTSVQIAPVLSPSPYLWHKSEAKNDAERLFKQLWDEGRYADAYALICDDEWLERNATPALMWNAAVLLHGDYLQRGVVKILSAKPDRDKARAILESLVNRYESETLDEVDGKILKTSQRFLKEFDDVNFLTFLAGMLILRFRAVEEDGNTINCNQRISALGDSAMIDDGYSLKVRPASTNGLGSLSSLYVEDEHGNVCDDIFSHLRFQRSEAGAWMAYLLKVAPTQLSYFWHGGYNHRKYILSHYDLDSLFEGKGIILGVEGAEEAIHPKVTFEGDTAIVECCYWNDCRGLVKERTSVRFDGERVVEIKLLHDVTLHRYDCMIRF